MFLVVDHPLFQTIGKEGVADRELGRGEVAGAFGHGDRSLRGAEVGADHDVGESLCPHVISANLPGLLVPFDEIIRLVKMTEIFTKWQDDRKAVTLTYIGLMTKYVHEIARRTEVAYKDLVFTSHEELIEALEGKVDVSFLQERRTQPFLRLYQAGKIVQSVCGDDAKAFRDQSL